MPFLLQLLLRALPLLAGVGGSGVARGVGARAAARFAPSLLRKAVEGVKPALKPGLEFLGDILGFAGGETLAEKIPGVPSTGEGFLERLPLLAAGFGGAHLAAGGLRSLAGKKGFGGLLSPKTGRLRTIPNTFGQLGGFIGGREVGSLFLPQSEHEDEGAQESMLHGNINSRSITQSDEEQFLELLNELQFQSEEEQSIDPELIQQIIQSATGQQLV